MEKAYKIVFKHTTETLIIGDDAFQIISDIPSLDSRKFAILRNSDKKAFAIINLEEVSFISEYPKTIRPPMP